MKLGIVLTVVWIIGGFAYAYFHIGIDQFAQLTANEFGDFLAGFSASLAFFWLVIGYFQQGQELRLQREELSLQREELSLQRKEMERLADEAAKQAKAVEGAEQHARRDTFLRVAELTITELHAIAVRLVKNLIGALEQDTWRDYEKGETDIYYKVLSDKFLENERQRSVERLRGRNLWPREVQRFCSKMDRLLEQANPCDPDGHLVEHFTESNLGIAHQLMKETLDE